MVSIIILAICGVRTWLIIGFSVINKLIALASIICQQELRLLGSIGIIDIYTGIVHRHAGSMIQVLHTQNKGMQFPVCTDFFRQSESPIQIQSLNFRNDIITSL